MQYYYTKHHCLLNTELNCASIKDVHDLVFEFTISNKETKYIQRGGMDKTWEHELNLKMTLEISYFERIGLLCLVKHLPSFRSQRCLLLPFLPSLLFHRNNQQKTTNSLEPQTMEAATFLYHLKSSTKTTKLN